MHPRRSTIIDAYRSPFGMIAPRAGPLRLARRHPRIRRDAILAMTACEKTPRSAPYGIDSTVAARDLKIDLGATPQMLLGPRVQTDDTPVMPEPVVHSADPVVPDPAETMQRLLSGGLISQLIAVAAELGLADQLTERPRPVAELAAATDTNAAALHRALRALATVGVFTEVQPAHFALTPLAATLRSDAEGSLRAWARMWGLPGRQQALAELSHSVRTGQPAAQRALGTDWWSYLRAHPDQADIFNAAMAQIAQRYPAEALQACPLPATGTLVDVGGGIGQLLASVLPTRPGLRGILFDQPHVLANAEPLLASAGIRDRVELAGGDFFLSAPSGADVYLLSMITHDWPDTDVTRILTVLRAAMPAHAHLIVLDAVLPSGDQPHRAKLIDVVMLALHPGRERTETELTELMTAAGFEHLHTHLAHAPVAALHAQPG
jgi:hypothetical protein